MILKRYPVTVSFRLIPIIFLYDKLLYWNRILCGPTWLKSWWQSELLTVYALYQIRKLKYSYQNMILFRPVQSWFGTVDKYCPSIGLWLESCQWPILDLYFFCTLVKSTSTKYKSTMYVQKSTNIYIMHVWGRLRRLIDFYGFHKFPKISNSPKYRWNSPP